MLGDFFFKSWHALKNGNRSDCSQNPTKLRMLRKVGLDNQSAFFGINTNRKIIQDNLVFFFKHFLWVKRSRKTMVINNCKNTVSFILKFKPTFYRAKIISNMQTA